jgi:hypothetical protein
MAGKKKNKPTVKKPSVNKAQLVEPSEKKSPSGGQIKESTTGVLFMDKASGAQIGFIKFDSSGMLVYQMIKTGMHVFAFKPIDLLLNQWIKEPLYKKHAKLLEEKSKIPDEILVQEANSCSDFLNSLESPLKLGGYSVKAQMVVVPDDYRQRSQAASQRGLRANAAKALEEQVIKDKSKKTKHKTKSTSTGSTPLNMSITLAACDPHARRIFEALVSGWKEVHGTAWCTRPGRIYLRLITKAHASGNSAQLPRNFNLIVLASPRGKRSAHIQVTWGLGKIKDLPPRLSTAYLDCIPEVVARFEKMVASLPGFEQKGSITRLMIDKQFRPLHAKLLINGMKEVKAAEAKVDSVSESKKTNDKVKKLTPPERYYEKLSLESFEGFIATIDRMYFKLTGKTSKRTPDEEAEMRAKFEKMKADYEKEQAALKKQQESRD